MTIFILSVLVSPTFSKYCLIPVAKQAVIKSLIVAFYFLAALLISLKSRSLLVPAFFTPDNYLLPSCKGFLSYFKEANFAIILGMYIGKLSLKIILCIKLTFLIGIKQDIS